MKKIVIFLVLFFTNSLFAITPSITSITPNITYNTTDTLITIKGTNFIAPCNIGIQNNDTNPINSLKPFFGGYSNSVLSGDYAYISSYYENKSTYDTTYSFYLSVYNVKNPLKPNLLSFYNYLNGIDIKEYCKFDYLSGVFVYKKYVYIVCLKKIIVIDINNLLIPNKINEYELPLEDKTENRIFIINNYLYVFNQSNEGKGIEAKLKIIDLEDPKNIKTITTFVIPDMWTGSLKYNSNCFYATQRVYDSNLNKYEFNLVVIDVSDTLSPHAFVSNLFPYSNYSGEKKLLPINNYLYIKSSYNDTTSLMIYDVKNKQKIEKNKEIILNKIKLSGRDFYNYYNYIYFATNPNSGLIQNSYLIDISDSTSLKLVNTNENNHQFIDSKGDYLFTGAGFFHKSMIGLSCKEVTFIDSNTITAVLPKGLPADFYNITVSNADFEHDVICGGVLIQSALDTTISNKNDTTYIYNSTYLYNTTLTKNNFNTTIIKTTEAANNSSSKNCIISNILDKKNLYFCIRFRDEFMNNIVGKKIQEMYYGWQ